MALVRSRASISGGGSTRALTSSAALTNGTSGSLLTTLTLTNTVASTKTNQFVYFPVPALSVSSSNTLAIYDDNGSGAKGSLLGNFQVRKAGDRASLGRHFTNGMIVPSIGSSATRILHIESTSTAAPTGTAVTASDVLALAGMANGGIVFECVISGTTYSATLEDMLIAGAGTFGKTSDRAEVWTSGPTFTYFACNGPIRNGGTAHNSGDTIHVFMRGMVWKETTAAVGGGNPILGMDFDVYIENGAVDRGTAADITMSSWTVKRATSLSDATLISTNDTDADGNTIDYTSGGSEAAIYGARSTLKRVFIGDKPVCIWAYGTNSSANVTDDTHWDYIRSTKVVPNFDIDYADVDHSSAMTSLDASGLGNLYATGKGEIEQYGEPSSGARMEIAPLMYASQKGMAKWNADGRKRLFGHAQIQQNYPAVAMRRYEGSPSTGAVGCWSRWDSSTQYKYNNAFSSATLIAWPASPTTPWSLDAAHGPERCVAAYLMSGRLPYLEVMCAFASLWHTAHDGAYLGHTSDKTFYGPLSSGGTLGSSHCFSPQTTIQERGQVWALRDVGLLGLLTPDDVTGDKIVWPKTSTNSWLANHMTRAAAVAAANTGGANRWATDGPRWTQVITDNGTVYGPWQSSYHMEVLHWLIEAGQSDTNMEDFTDWYSVGFLQTGQADVAYQYYMGEYYCPVTSDDGLTDYKTWADCYRQHARKGGSNTPPTRKVASGNFTLGATSGNDASLESPYATTFRSSWHEGGVVRETGSGSGVGALDQVTDGNTARMDISSAFSGTTIAAANLFLPYPHPLDAEAARVYTPTDFNNYLNLGTSARAMMKDRGYTGAATEYATVVAWRALTAQEISIRPRT